jgi:uncharacterized repeat protein (TIGR03806 family)
LVVESKVAARACRVAWLLVASLPIGTACGNAVDARVLFEPWIAGLGPRQPAFLAFSSAYDGAGAAPLGAPEFPKLLSQTGAFADAASLKPASGIVPYEIQAPLWSDGADKRRWVSVPDGATLGYSESEPFEIPRGTVFIKHFEMALDERFPDERRRLETRFWVAVSEDAQYGVTYKWNDEQTDAELLVASETDLLSIVGVDGETRAQPYFYPAPADCHTCHNQPAGFALGVRTAQLNRRVVYRLDRPPVDQLSTWSTWGLLDTRLDAAEVHASPRLAPIADESLSLEDRVRSYWDGNCAFCHAGADGVVPGWDARHSIALEDQGLDRSPNNPAAGASQLIAPGSPEDSLIYLRGATTDPVLSMPPLGRNRVDDLYIDVLGRWIASLGAVSSGTESSGTEP